MPPSSRPDYPVINDPARPQWHFPGPNEVTLQATPAAKLVAGEAWSMSAAPVIPHVPQIPT